MSMMVLSYQSSEGHTTLTGLTDAEIDAKFAELISHGYAAFADTKVDDPVQVLSTQEAHDLHAQEIYMIAPLQGG